MSKRVNVSISEDLWYDAKMLAEAYGLRWRGGPAPGLLLQKLIKEEKERYFITKDNENWKPKEA